MSKSNEIHDYWDRKAEDLKTDPSATMKDVILRSMEIEAIAARLTPEDDLLDVGGGNAYAGVQWAPRCRSVLVTDFSEKMVCYAREAIAASGLSNLRAERASVLDLSAYREKFSAASCVRVLINITSPEEQWEAVDQLAGTLRPGGRLFLIEGLEETFTEMNRMREAMGLQAIALDWHNRLLKQSLLEERLSRRLRIVERVDFGEYYFLSRIFHPFLVAPEEPSFQGRANQIARTIWQNGVLRGRLAEISTLMLYVCRRES
jgi:ubiquinone/menaquinone biosynthesis C-methylase UbiE